MTAKLYVGNLSYSETEEGLREVFSSCGVVESVKIITDRDTGRSKGFGFVEMATDEEAEKAVSEINGKEQGGRTLKVSPARPREQSSRGGHGGGRRHGRF